jgi:hypothetical protein
MSSETEKPVAAAINSAEDLGDPLDGLIRRTATDPGVPFMPEVVERLAELKKTDRAAFETLRAQLKRVGCRVAALDEAVTAENGGFQNRGSSQTDVLIELARPIEFFHTVVGTGYADLDINGHRETWPVRGGVFRPWAPNKLFNALFSQHIFYCGTNRWTTPRDRSLGTDQLLHLGQELLA